MAKQKEEELIFRSRNNPIISISDIPYAANTVFNAGAVQLNGETLLLLRIEDRRGISHLTVARSDDGISNWRIDIKPTFSPDPERYPEEEWGIEDPRITFLEERKQWAIAYTAYSKSGPLVSLATTTDFIRFNRHGPVMPPEDKDAALFPVRFDGRWAMLHRPVSSFVGAGAHIWLSFSPDLKHWGEHQVLIAARKGGWWDAKKVGLSPPPLATEAGWLLLYHGVKVTASGAIYRLGLALLDLDNPRKVIARSDEWIFNPKEPYELYGDVDKVVFPCGWIAEKDDIRLYYGAADTCIALATSKVSAILDWLFQHNSL